MKRLSDIDWDHVMLIFLKCACAFLIVLFCAVIYVDQVVLN